MTLNLPPVSDCVGATSLFSLSITFTQHNNHKFLFLDCPSAVYLCVRVCVFLSNWPWKWKWRCAVVSDSFDPMDCSLPGSSVHGIFQARILEWVAISFSGRSSRLRDWTQVSCIVGRHFTVWATREVWPWDTDNWSLHLTFYLLCKTLEQLDGSTHWLHALMNYGNLVDYEIPHDI